MTAVPVYIALILPVCLFNCSDETGSAADAGNVQGEDASGSMDGAVVDAPTLDAGMDGAIPDTTGTVTVIHNTIPKSERNFSYQTDLGAPTIFDLDDDEDASLSNTQVFEAVETGVYDLATTSPRIGYDLSLACVDPDEKSTVGDGTARIAVEAGEAIVCTFTWTEWGTITLIHDAVPDSPVDITFATDIVDTDDKFALDDDTDPTLSNMRVFTSVAAGSYVLATGDVAGFDLSIDCVDPDGGTTVAGGVATIDLDLGESVTCTFSRIARGSVTVVQDTTPNHPQDFSFTSNVPNGPATFTLDDDGTDDLPNTMDYNDVVPGSYTIAQNAVAGFSSSVACVDPDAGTTIVEGVAMIDVDPGETIVCTFTSQGATLALDASGAATELLLVGDYGSTGCQDFSSEVSGIELIVPQPEVVIADFGEGDRTWFPVTRNTEQSGLFDLRSYFSNNDNRAGYAHLYLISPVEQDVNVLWSGDDGVQLWVNGSERDIYPTKPIVCSGTTVDEFSHLIHLNAGYNRILWRGTNGGGVFSLFFRFVDMAGMALDMPYSLSPN